MSEDSILGPLPDPAAAAVSGGRLGTRTRTASTSPFARVPTSRSSVPRMYQEHGLPDAQLPRAVVLPNPGPATTVVKRAFRDSSSRRPSAVRSSNQGDAGGGVSLVVLTTTWSSPISVMSFPRRSPSALKPLTCGFHRSLSGVEPSLSKVGVTRIQQREVSWWPRTIFWAHLALVNVLLRLCGRPAAVLLGRTLNWERRV